MRIDFGSSPIPEDPGFLDLDRTGSVLNNKIG